MPTDISAILNPPSDPADVPKYLQQMVPALAQALGERVPFQGALVNLTSEHATIANSTSTSITWDEANYDTDSFWSAGAPTRLTIPVGSGITRVRLKGSLRWESSTAANRRITFMAKNGGSFTGRATDEKTNQTQTGAVSQNVATPVLTVTEEDYFELLAFQNSGSDHDLDNVLVDQWFSIEVVEQ